MIKARSNTPLEAVNEIRNRDGQVVLVLQGGGALGAYQGGVYQALNEAGIEPDWIIGTSIGAINAGIIAGNEAQNRLAKLQEFWKRVERADFWGAFPAWAGAGDALASWMTLTSGISGFFEPHTRAFLGAHIRLGADNSGYYSTEPLRKTLEELADFSLINKGKPRLTVGAAHVRTSMMHYFDSKEMRGSIQVTSWLPARCRRLSRQCASTASSTGMAEFFPTLRQSASSTTSRGATPSSSRCICGIRRAGEPETIWQVLNRHKDIQYSSRIASHIVRQRETHKLRHVITQLLQYVPEEEKNDPLLQELAGYRCDTRMHVVRLLSPRLDNESHTKDVDFSPAGIRQRWEAGYTDTMSALWRQPWIGEFGLLNGVVLHEPQPGAEPAAEIEPAEPCAIPSANAPKLAAE